jgi:hypothetical protein
MCCDIHALPTDTSKWWISSHCSPGHTDETDLCECGLMRFECAAKCTQWIRDSHEQWCGGSGFWCPNCNLFYAQDTCGESEIYEHATCNDLQPIEIVDQDGEVWCVCAECSQRFVRLDVYEEDE